MSSALDGFVDILVEILSHLDCKSLGRAACVSSVWREAAERDALWLAASEVEYAASSVVAQSQLGPVEGESWRAWFLRHAAGGSRLVHWQHTARMQAYLAKVLHWRLTVSMLGRTAPGGGEAAGMRVVAHEVVPSPQGLSLQFQLPDRLQEDIRAHPDHPVDLCVRACFEGGMESPPLLEARQWLGQSTIDSYDVLQQTGLQMWDRQSDAADTHSSPGEAPGAAAVPARGVVVDAYLHFEGLLHPPPPAALPQVLAVTGRRPGLGEMQGAVQEVCFHVDLHELGGGWLASLHGAMRRTLLIWPPATMAQRWGAVHPVGIVISERAARLCAPTAGDIGPVDGDGQKLAMICNMDNVAADAAVFDSNGACVLGRLSLDLWKRGHQEVHLLPFSIDGQVAATPFANAFIFRFQEGFRLELTMEVTLS